MSEIVCWLDFITFWLTIPTIEARDKNDHREIHKL